MPSSTRLCATLLALSCVSSALLAQAPASPVPQLQPAAGPIERAAVPGKLSPTDAALRRVIESPEFGLAERKGDVATMRRLLRTTGVKVMDPVPSATVLCLPSPPKQLYWSYANFNGVFMMGWVCVNGSTGGMNHIHLIDMMG